MDRKRPTWECAGCRRQTSVTVGTFMHDSHLPLKTWFLAAHIVATHSNGISALQLQGQLGIGSYKTAWLLLQKLRRAMVDPERSLLQTLVEIDETEMPFRSKHSKHDPVDKKKGGRSPVGKIFIVGAVELSEDGQPRRIRLVNIPDGSSKTPHGFIGKVVTPGARVVTDGWLGYENPPANPYEVRVVEGQKAQEVLKGSTGSSRTSSDGPRASSTDRARPMSSVISTNSSSAGTDDATPASPLIVFWGSAWTSGLPPIAISAIRVHNSSLTQPAERRSPVFRHQLACPRDRVSAPLRQQRFTRCGAPGAKGISLQVGSNTSAACLQPPMRRTVFRPLRT